MTDQCITRTRQRKYKHAPPLAVPNIDDDAAERKRVLNVLAQRRYREKKRISRLKAKTSDDDASRPTELPEILDVLPESSLPTESPVEAATERGTLTATGITVPIPSPSPSPSFITGLDLCLSSWDPLDDTAFTSLLPDSGILPDFLSDDNTAPGASAQQPNVASTFSGRDSLPSLVGTTSFDNSSISCSPDHEFTDSYRLPVLELTLLKAVMRIAGRIGCESSIWELDCVSPFHKGIATPADQLPVAWRPTPSQVMISHHPLFDFLPWPGVRERAIMILSMDDELRPPNARGPLAVANFAYDVEDSAEGVRIYGGDPYDPGSWEVGQRLFESWWFLFDKEIIKTSNRWRRLRGAAPLSAKGTSPSPSPGASASSGGT